jgi:hypothetical protein
MADAATPLTVVFITGVNRGKWRTSRHADRDPHLQARDLLAYRQKKNTHSTPQTPQTAANPFS